MATPDESLCPACGAGPGTLSIGEQLQARPFGSYSLAGAQLKVAAVAVPVLACSACGLRITGRYDGDGRHATFPSPEHIPTERTTR